MSRTRRLAAEYDAALGNLLMVPRTPIEVTRSPPRDLSRAFCGAGASIKTSSKAPFGIAHRWAVVGPCSIMHGLAAVLTVVGNHVDEPEPAMDQGGSRERSVGQ